MPVEADDQVTMATTSSLILFLFSADNYASSLIFQILFISDDVKIDENCPMIGFAFSYCRF